MLACKYGPTPYSNQAHKTYLNKTRQEMPSKVHLRMWEVLVCEFGLFNQIQRCKKLQSPSQNVGSFGFVNLVILKILSNTQTA